MNNPYVRLLVLYSFVGSLCVVCQQPAFPQPQERPQADNLVPESTISSGAGWALHGDATFEPQTSRTEDGSGSLKLVTTATSMAFSDFIPIVAGRKYTLSFFAKTINGPTYIGGQVCLYNADKQFLKNLPSAGGSTTLDDAWQEFAIPVFVPDEAGAAFVQVQVYKGPQTQPDSAAWVDELNFFQGLGLRQPPTDKRSFQGQHVRVDELGNFEVRKHGEWIPFFPLCMYSDNYQDWSLYSRQGWNTIIWTGAAHQVRQAKEAVSDFNPDGMLAGFQISQYTFPSGWAYNDLNDLEKRLREIFDNGLGEQLLLYYWDNENNHDQWQVPVDVIRTIHRLDADQSGQRQHPVYALQGEFNIARVHAARGLVDVSGTYVDGAADEVGRTDSDRLWLLDRLEQQTSPAAFAQFNDVQGPGDMRLRLYNSLIVGARAMGYWRDCLSPNCTSITGFDGPVDEQKWWPDFPNLRREIDRLLPLIREPHWTAWSAAVDQGPAVRIGTRDHDGQGYLLVVNQTSQEQTVVVSLSDLPYSASEVRNLFSDRVIAAISANTFSITLPPIGVGSGTCVLRLVRADGPN